MSTRTNPDGVRIDPLAHLDEAQRAALARAKRAARWVGVILPLALTAIATIVLVLWIPRMPDPMAVHWGPDMTPDGFGPPWMNAAMAAGLGLAMTALSWLQGLQTWQARQRGTAVWSSMFRILPAIVLGAVVFMQVIAVGTAWVQLDAVDARQTVAIGWVVLAAFGLWIGVTLIAFLAQPKLRIEAPGSGPVAPMPLATSERAVWVGEVRPSRVFVWVIAVALVMLAAMALWAFSVEPWAGAVVAGSFLLVLVLALISTWFRVRIDDAGLEARALLGWPVFRLRADDVVSVAAAQVMPFAEYGGWGMRWTPDRFGIVMRTGEGIVATRRNGRLFAVTVDDAPTGAALLAAAAQRASGGAGAEARTAAAREKERNDD